VPLAFRRFRGELGLHLPHEQPLPHDADESTRMTGMATSPRRTNHVWRPSRNRVHGGRPEHSAAARALCIHPSTHGTVLQQPHHLWPSYTPASCGPMVDGDKGQLCGRVLVLQPPRGVTARSDAAKTRSHPHHRCHGHVQQKLSSAFIGLAS
jgi:hypothetical protein